jgi:AraC-like DNA-binding protein
LIDPLISQGFQDHIFSDLGKDDLQVSRAGSFQKKISHSKYFSKDIYAISFVVAGKGFWKKDDGPSHSIQPGSSFLTHPGHLYQFGPTPAHPWKEYFLVFRGSRPGRWVKDALLPEEDRPHTLPHPNRLKKIFDQLFSIDQFNSQFRRLRTINLIEQLLLERSIQLEGKKSELPQLVKLVLQHCWDDSTGQVDFEALATSHGVSYSHLRKTFREHISLPPQKYLNKVRARKAQHLLDDHNLSITDVALEMNYPDLFSFSRHFKTYTGQSPRAYRGK